jgi:hypothetical protein
MPRVNINFQNNIIYRIVSTDNKMLYMGSTTEFNKTKNRLKDMTLKPDKPKGKHAKLWSDIHDAGGWDTVVMLQVKKYPCMDARETETEVFRLQQEYRMEQLNINFKWLATHLVLSTIPIAQELYLPPKIS